MFAYGCPEMSVTLAQLKILSVAAASVATVTVGVSAVVITSQDEPTVREQAEAPAVQQPAKKPDASQQVARLQPSDETPPAQAEPREEARSQPAGPPAPVEPAAPAAESSAEPAPAATKPAATTPAATTPAATTPAATTPAATTPAATAETPEPTAKEPAAAEAAPAEPPEFEVIRIEPSGDGVFAGKAAPGAAVTLMSGDEPLGDTVADATGSWAIIIERPLPTGPSDLWLMANDGEGKPRRSKQALAVVIDEAKQDKPLAVLSSDTGASRIVQKPEPKREVQVASSQQAEAAPAADATQQTEQAGAQTSAAAGPAAAQTADSQPTAQDVKQEMQVASLPQQQASPEAQGAPAAAPQQQAAAEPGHIDPVSIEAADYAPDRKLHISGNATPGAEMRLYYDNIYLGDTKTDAAGLWTMSTDHKLDGGIHKIRADHVKGGGDQVLARAEVSFIARIPQSQRQVAEATLPQPESGSGQEGEAIVTAAVNDRQAAPADAGEAAGDAPGQADDTTAPAGSEQTVAAEAKVLQPRLKPEQPGAPNKIIVQKGDSLWRISREHYGLGIRYTTIYRANKDQIRDPHWIYPDQVFLLPRALGSGEQQTTTQ